MMTKYIIILFIGFAFAMTAQSKNYNTSKDYVAKGYDVTEYFNNKIVKGINKFTATYDQVNYKFVNQKNLDKFKKEPIKYIPQYGGYCAYAIAVNGEKVDINPTTFEIRDNKLYLFYNSWGINTLKKWEKEGATKLKNEADENWKKIIIKK